jgi:hypothetical protein
LSTIQFRLAFKDKRHKPLEYCCVVIHLTSISTISYAESNGGIFILIAAPLRPDSTSAFSPRNAKYFACFFWIATTRINYFYLIAHNSKETGEIFRREKAPVESGLSNYFASFFWIASNQVEIIYSSGRNSKETGEIIRISPRKSARGIRPLGITNTKTYCECRVIVNNTCCERLVNNTISLDFQRP